MSRRKATFHLSPGSLRGDIPERFELLSLGDQALLPPNGSEDADDAFSWEGERGERCAAPPLIRLDSEVWTKPAAGLEPTMM